MAKIDFPYPFISQAWGTAASTKWQRQKYGKGRVQQTTFLADSRRPNYHQDILTEVWNDPAAGPSTPVSPFSHSDSCLFWTWADHYYSINKKWMNLHWRGLNPSPRINCYDKWMKVAVPHMHRCLSKSRYPITPYRKTFWEFEQDPKLLYPGFPASWFLWFPDSYSHRGCHHMHIDQRAVYFEGPFPPDEDPPNPVQHFELGYESRLVADALWWYNPHPRYFPGVKHPERTMGYAVLEAYDKYAPRGKIAGGGIGPIRPYHEHPCFTTWLPSWYSVTFWPPLRNSQHIVTENAPDPDKSAKFFWLTPTRPWKHDPQKTNLPKFWYNDNARPWGAFIDYGDYFMFGYHLPHEDCHYKIV